MGSLLEMYRWRIYRAFRNMDDVYSDIATFFGYYDVIYWSSRYGMYTVQILLKPGFFVCLNQI